MGYWSGIRGYHWKRIFKYVIGTCADSVKLYHDTVTPIMISNAMLCQLKNTPLQYPCTKAIQNRVYIS